MAAPKIKSLSQQYIFYEQLKDESDPNLVDLYNRALAGTKKYAEYYRDNEKDTIARNLTNMGQAELHKEQALLKRLTGLEDINRIYDLTHEQDVLDFIKDVNSILNLKGNFERNIKRIKNYTDKGQVNIASFFDGYFRTAWNRSRPHIAKHLAQYISNNMEDPQLEEKVSEELKIRILQVVRNAIMAMFKSDTFSKTPDQVKTYQELINTFNQFSGSNQLIQRLYDAFGLEDFKNSLTQQLMMSNNKTHSQSIINQYSADIVSKGHYSKGGLTLEYLENHIINELIEGLVSNDKNISIQKNKLSKMFHTGSLGIKADNILTVDVDYSVVDDLFDELQGKQISRKTNIEAFEKMNKSLQKYSDGFVVYSSAKNYLARKDFPGFSSGVPVSVETLNKITHDSSKMGAILQTAKGAVGANFHDDISMSIAEDIAYFLFDDIETIGTEQVNSAKAIHLFNLDGIYMPLSVLLFSVATAVSEVKRVPSSLINVSIKTPNILYGQKEEYTMEDWNKQRETAIQETTISTHFMKNFFDLMKKYPY